MESRRPSSFGDSADNEKDPSVQLGEGSFGASIRTLAAGPAVVLHGRAGPFPRRGLSTVRRRAHAPSHLILRLKPARAVLPIGVSRHFRAVACVRTGAAPNGTEPCLLSSPHWRATRILRHEQRLCNDSQASCCRDKSVMRRALQARNARTPPTLHSGARACGRHPRSRVARARRARRDCRTRCRRAP